jgi:hypothetical protein
VTAEIEHWDSQALKNLIERGSMTAGEIVESVDHDQFELPIAQAWVESAPERGLIAKSGGGNASTRYNVMAAGRNEAAARTGRFVSEKARDGERSRQA